MLAGINIVYLRTDEIFRLSRSEKKKSRSLSLDAFLARFRSLSLSLPGLRRAVKSSGARKHLSGN